MKTSFEERLSNIVLEIFKKHSEREINEHFLDLLEKFISYDTSQLSVENLEWILKLKPKDLDNYINNPASVFAPYLQSIFAKFDMDDELGFTIVPSNYIVGDDFDFIAENVRSYLHYQNKQISEKNYPEPSYPLSPGCTFEVRTYSQMNEKEETTSDERYLFCVAASDAHLGLYGLLMLYQQKSKLLVPGIIYTSFEEPYHSLRGQSGERIVTSLEILEDGKPLIYYEPFKDKKWGPDDLIVCFYPVSSEE